MYGIVSFAFSESKSHSEDFMNQIKEHATEKYLSMT